MKNSIYDVIKTNQIMDKQEIWRQKQIDKYYLSGRPLFQNKNNFNYNEIRFIMITKNNIIK